MFNHRNTRSLSRIELTDEQIRNEAPRKGRSNSLAGSYGGFLRSPRRSGLSGLGRGLR